MRELFKYCSIPIIYILSLFNASIFIHKIKLGSSPSAFAYYTKAKIRLKRSRFQILLRGLTICNEFVGNAKKELESISLFKARIKSKLLELENEIASF